jgi:hypothetical protein
MSRKQAYLIATPLFLLSFWSMNYTGAPLKTDAAPNGIISYEFMKDMACVDKIHASWAGIKMQYAALNMGLDFLFLVAYSCFFYLLCKSVADKFPINSFLNKLGHWLGLVQFVAAALDAVENICLVQILFGSRDESLLSMAHVFTNIKFALIGLGLAYILIGFISSFLIKKQA